MKKQIDHDPIASIENMPIKEILDNLSTISLTPKEAERLIDKYATAQIVNPSGTTITQLDFTEDSKALLLQEKKDKEIRSILTSNKNYPKDLFINSNRQIKNAKVLNKKEEIKAIDKTKPIKHKYNQAKRNQILEKLQKQNQEKNRARER